ncbi:MAG: isoprenylcysteine carboxylmethyltransferase family protein [Nitrospirota bacterium]
MNNLALITLMAWPVIPVFWIPVHVFPDVFRRLGLFSYAVPLIIWLPAAYVIYTHRDFFLHFRTDFPFAVRAAGLVLLITGTGIHIWTGKLLSLWGLIGLPEVWTRAEGRLVTSGAFSLVRHPTYLAHTLMFSGIFLFTGVISVAVLTAVDLLAVILVIIPFEEKELLSRFGEEYRTYVRSVPKFIHGPGGGNETICPEEYRPLRCRIHQPSFAAP